MRPVELHNVVISDPFWSKIRNLVKNVLLPYQWRALNDGIDGAEKSFCVHNFKAAARLNARRGRPGFLEPQWSDPGFSVFPGADETPDPDKFYGFVFQDSDLYKWLEAAAYILASERDPELEATCDGAVELIAAAQLPSGYIDTYYILSGMERALTNLRDNHELYCMGHLIEAACAYYEATGKDRLLNVARGFADFVYLELGPSGRPGYPGHEIAEMALARLSELTGDKKYLELAELFIKRRGTEPNYFTAERRKNAALDGKPVPDDTPARLDYYQAAKPVLEQDEAVGHAVRCMYLASGMADVARLTGDEPLRDACDRLWHSAVHEKMYITGGVGGTRDGEAFSCPFDLPSDAAYSETCAAVGLVFFAGRMLRLRPASEYADVMERALFNACLSGMSLDGRSFFYVNPLEAVPELIRRDSRLSHVDTRRQKWFGCACCPPNLARLLSNLGSYAYARDDDTLWVNLYVGGSVRQTLGGVPVCLSVRSDIPFSGRVELSLDLPEPASFTLALRVPGWTDPDTPVAVPDGVTYVTRDGYMYISGLWRPGDAVTADFPMPVTLTAASPAVRECVGKTCVSRGPVVYCAEEADNGKDLHLLRLDTSDLSAVEVKSLKISGFDLPSVSIPVKKLRGGGTGLYTPLSPPEEDSFRALLIPYFAWANRAEGEMRVWLRY